MTKPDDADPVAPQRGDPDPSRAAQGRLIEALRERLRDPGGGQVRLLETHISYVILTGTHALKIKKAVRLGFLDFSTLAARRRFCEEELRLNRRLAPALYLDVVAITGVPERPEIGGDGPVLEYAVRMREFPQAALVGNVLSAGALPPARIDELAAIVARFHDAIPAAAPGGPLGRPEDILGIALANFTELRPLCVDPADQSDLDTLEAWTRSEYALRSDALAARQRTGFVRECHGDLHLGNVAIVDGAMTVFDCIEFNDRMRWIDVASEVAFTVMDLEHRGRADLAFRFLAAYLEASGDFGGVGVLRFYVVYRAMVRAKVAALRAMQLPDGPARAALRQESRECLVLAAAWAAAPQPALVLMHGFAGCGKSTLAQGLLERTRAIRIRTDVERKRLHGIPPGASSRSGTGTGLYTAAATRAAYHYVAALARAALHGGHSVIVDATFLQRWQRDLFGALADAQQVRFVILDVVASPDTLRARIARRMERGGDASEADLAVLDRQLLTAEPLAADERDGVIVVDAEAPLSDAQLTRIARSVLAKADAAPAANGGATAPPVPAADLAAALAFLARPDSYAEGAGTVAVVETHMSWVFLTDLHGWKLKKPVVTPDVDLRDIAARLCNAVDELRVNRRLAPDVYVGAFPLIRDAVGRLTFDADGEVVDWLVKMRRLPAHRMLDQLLQRGAVEPADVDALVARLCVFYRDARRIGTTADDYVRRFADSIARFRTELTGPAGALPNDLVEHVCARQLDALESTDALDARVRADLIVEGHGDLRPEHVCLTDTPQIIDGLEFSLLLRALDPVDEVAYLALECERLGAPHIGTRILEAYRAESGDAPPAPLVSFYQAYRACVRATLAIRHLRDPAPQDPQKWSARAKQYLELARARVDGGIG